MESLLGSESGRKVTGMNESKPNGKSMETEKDQKTQQQKYGNISPTDWSLDVERL
jgi:hypothetical protein